MDCNTINILYWYNDRIFNSIYSRYIKMNKIEIGKKYFRDYVEVVEDEKDKLEE